jgi:hypothetical protein
VELWNSDQGSQFTAAEFLAPFKQRGILISMGGLGRALDTRRRGDRWPRMSAVAIQSRAEPGSSGGEAHDPGGHACQRSDRPNSFPGEEESAADDPAGHESSHRGGPLSISCGFYFEQALYLVIQNRPLKVQAVLDLACCHFFMPKVFIQAV